MVECFARLCRERLDHDVRGLDVAVDDPLAVRVVEGGGDLAGDIECLVERHDAVGELASPLGERRAGSIAHHHHRVAGREAHFGASRLVPDVHVSYGMQDESTGNVGMREARDKPELVPQNIHFLRVRLQERMERFQGDLDA